MGLLSETRLDGWHVADPIALHLAALALPARLTRIEHLMHTYSVCSSETLALCCVMQAWYARRVRVTRGQGGSGKRA
jgi:hypothetical protein